MTFDNVVARRGSSLCIKARLNFQAWKKGGKPIYYMEESVLLGTKPLVRRFHTPLHPGPEWRIFRMSPL